MPRNTDDGQDEQDLRELRDEVENLRAGNLRREREKRRLTARIAAHELGVDADAAAELLDEYEAALADGDETQPRRHRRGSLRSALSRLTDLREALAGFADNHLDERALVEN